MIKNIELTNEQEKDYIKQLYDSFDNGYQFEEFLKIYFEKLGLDEVSVTKRSRDGGVDLTAIRPGIGNFSDSDVIHYYIQAKRFEPTSTIPVTSIRELKGTIPFGQKGIFVTTAKFSKDAILESNNNPSNPVVLIDGKKLIESCIEHEIGFVFVPVFKKQLIQDMLSTNNKTVETAEMNEGVISVDKMITANDIRARIIRLPNEIIKTLESNVTNVRIKLGNDSFRDYKFNTNAKFISGVTSFFIENGFVDSVGSYCPKKVVWIKDEEGIKVFVDGE